MRRDALLNLILTKQGGTHWGCEGQHSLDCSDHEMVKFKTLRAGRKVAIKLTTPEFRMDSAVPRSS